MFTGRYQTIIAAIVVIAAFGIIYAAVYVLLGMTAIMVWGLDDNPPDLIKNLATVALGLLVPIVTAFFQEN